MTHPPTLTLYGLPHCDTCKKARAWLTARGIAHEFVDYRAQPLAPAQLEQAAAALGWDKLVNRASTTWRQLEAADKAAVTTREWLELLARHPALIRRPLLIDGSHIDAGFKESRYAAHFVLGADA
ncbi:MAG: Spx/MgsR family RNA polymerase-binding regulatory protein [Lysobacterales bacterium]